jgi:hypothetical protein
MSQGKKITLDLLFAFSTSFIPLAIGRPCLNDKSGREMAGGVVALHQVHNQIPKMADRLSIGMINQFPERFK